ncbi:uncharacterized protein LOC109717845 [Ananas comosus]|uniref:Uncharacterized protein LOC109717845 n=1 Tax=Ananas comosus TaxID=4615 RepID=A0A6P5G0Z2_ANACO|nr:uncharacterized protein LOC109717845 [Ananas comosus]
MEPSPFVRVTVESLAVKLPAVTRPAGPGVHPSTTPCFCTLRIPDVVPSQTAASVSLPLADDPTAAASSASAPSTPVVISLGPDAVRRLAGKPAGLVVTVYAGRSGSTCGVSAGRAMGRVRVGVDVEGAGKGGKGVVVAHSGWVPVGSGSGAMLHLVVRAEPDPRFVFQFGGEPECSPVVYQVQRSGRGGGCVRQPVFSCRFSADRRRCTTRSRSLPSDPDQSSAGKLRSWFGSFGRERDRRYSSSQRRMEQRKGWTVTIHDLSGSPVAAASMVTPFVPSRGSDRVSRANPGAWLILRAAAGPHGSGPNWEPWGRLEAWRDRGPVDALGYRFDLLSGPGPGVGAGSGSAIRLAESVLSVRRGGKFAIDLTEGHVAGSGPSGGGGFVMGCAIEGEGKVSRPTVEVGVSHVTCVADAALFVALSAAVDLSMDACKLFSRRLRKELCGDQDQD